MRTTSTLVVGAVAGGVLVLSSTRAAACTPAEAGPSRVAPATPWRDALDELVRASADPERPWGCAGGLVDLVEHDGRATLTVTSADGHRISREVDAPEDVVPMGQALLLRPLLVEAPPGPKAADPAPPAAARPRSAATPAPPQAVAELPRRPPVPAERLAPSALVTLLLSPRLTGTPDLVLGGVAVRGEVPFGAFRGGGWARYDALSLSLDPRRPDALRELCVGAVLGRRLVRDPLELQASVSGSLAVMFRSGPPDEDGTFLDGRGGLDLKASFPLAGAVRFAAALDAELAPAQLGGSAAPGPSGRHRRDLPSYTLGLGLGVELAL